MHRDLYAKIRFARFFVTLSSVLFIVNTQASAAGWVSSTVSNLTGGNIHADAMEMSEILGVYPSGTTLYVYDPPKNGFYPIYLKTPLNGSHYAWISQNDIELTQPQSNFQDSNPTANTEKPDDLDKSKNWSLAPRLGYSAIIFQQPSGLATNLLTSALVGQLDFDWRFRRSPIKVGTGLSYTLLPITQNLSGTTVRWLTAFFKAGVEFKVGPARVEISGGGIYESMNVSNNTFGYTPFVLPGVFPILTLRLSDQLELIGKLVYATNLSKLLPTAELNFAGAIAWEIKPDQKVTAEIHSSNINYGTVNSNLMQQQVMSFKLGYTF